LLRAIEAEGHAAFIVGGAVRDLTFGGRGQDVDIATSMPLEELGRFCRTVDIGRSKSFGLVTVLWGGHSFEVARFRGATHHDAVGQPTGMDPAATFKEDASRRDFTLNAMALDSHGNLLDPFGGQNDIAARLIRCVGDPRERMAEDPLRALRAVRFAARFGFEIEAGTAHAVREIAPRVVQAAAERVARELTKMASQPGPVFAHALQLLSDLDLLPIVLPEIQALHGLEHDADDHPEGDVWEHTLAALRANPQPDQAVNLAVLFHDVGKAVTHELRNGEHTYHGHDRAGTEIIRTLSERLKLGHDLTGGLAFAAENHMKALRLREMRPAKVVRLVADEHWPLLKQVARCDQAARGDAAAGRDLDRLFLGAEARAADQPKGPVISGKRVMELTGLPPGPRIGEIVREVTDWVVDQGVDRVEVIEDRVVGLGRGGKLESD
jgi:tRNA nucleotidyltransferase/poly(A) polymerase